MIKLDTQIPNEGTVKLPGSDELNGSLTTYVKFWTRLTLLHSTNDLLRKNPVVTRFH
jgi:hypothetical protein